MSATVWIPAVPLPFKGFRTVRCSCGRRFRGRDRMANYELHWRRVHEPYDEDPEHPWAQMSISIDEAERIYAELRA